MKQVFTVILFAVVFICKGQIRIDMCVEKEIGEIIMNYKAHGIQKFKIKYQESMRGGSKVVFFYSFENDTVFTHHYTDYTCYVNHKSCYEKSDTSKFVIRKGKFVYCPSASDLKDYPPSKNFFFKTVDSGNVKINKCFNIKGSDTVLNYRERITFDSNNLEIRKLWGYSDNYANHLTETEYLKGDTVFVKESEFKYGNWILRTAKRTKKSVIEEPYKKTEIEYDDDFNYQQIQFENIQRTLLTTKTTYFNKQNVISKIRVERKGVLENKIGYVDKNLFTVKILR